MSIEHPTFNGLKSLEYNKDYYDEHVAGGLDYLGHGYWQESYGRMISDATMQANYDRPFMIDAGCACGSILMGFKKSKAYDRVLGVDLSEYMVKLGRQHFGHADHEIVPGSITDIPVESNSASLVHSAQVLEHIPDHLTEAILAEFYRVLRPGGRAFLCLDAIRQGENKEMYMGDPTHVNIKPIMYWTEKLQSSGLLFDVEAYNRFVTSRAGPTENVDLSFFQTYPYWSAWTLIKPLDSSSTSLGWQQQTVPAGEARQSSTASKPAGTTSSLSAEEHIQLAALNKKIEILTSLVGPNSQPNINALTDATRHLTAMAMNVKFFGYEIARALAAALPIRSDLSPMAIPLSSKPSTQADLESDWVAYWSSQLKVPVVFHRKLWEFCYVLQALHNAGALSKGKRGLGFGCGEEPLPSLMASLGAEVVVTDLDPREQAALGWSNSNEHTKALSSAYKEHLVTKEDFDSRVSLEYVDMKSIPEHLRDFDFCWSICALEHLGTIEAGIKFIEDSMNILKPGGVAVHTTEFNFSRDDINFDNWNPVTFQKRHFEEIAERLRAKGYKVEPLDFDFGNKPLDKFIDIPPFPYHMGKDVQEIWSAGQDHIKVSIDGIPVTCFGLTITK